MVVRTLTGFIWLRLLIKKDGDNVDLLAICTEGREFLYRVKTIWLERRIVLSRGS
jgi:hypothetical protein